MVPFSTIIASIFLQISPLYQILPLENEKLSDSIFLNQKCSSIQIQEWHNQPTDTSKEIEILNSVCNLTRDKIESFYAQSNKKCSNISVWKVNVSLLDRGEEVRKLNDLRFRFANRQQEKDPSGRTYSILGYFDFKTKHLFVLNNFQHSKFKTVWAHELFHSLNYHCGFYLSPIKEEQEAKKFTNFIGLGE